MGGPRKLLHGRVTKREHPERFQVKRKLFFSNFFSTAVMLSLVASQASATLLYKRESTKLQPPGITKPSAPLHRCNDELKVIVFEPGEIVRETVCGKNRTFVLTNTSLIVVTPSKDEEVETGIEGVTLKFTYTRTDMREILKNGLVTWTQTEDACYFLTQDKVLHRIVSIGSKEDDEEHLMPFDVQKARMIYHSGFIFIAAPVSGRLMIMRFSNKPESGGVPLLFDAKNPEFFISNGKLYFGEKDGKKAEIRIDGQCIGDIKVIEDQ